MKEHRISDLQNAYNAIKSPAELDMVIRRSIMKANKTKKNKQLLKNIFAPIAAALLVFLFTVNIVPEFGRAMEEVPGLGWIVRMVRLENYVVGGEITDGQQIGQIEVRKDSITIPFVNHGDPADTAPWFKATMQAYPYGLLLEIQGIRSLFNDGAMPEIVDSPLIKSIYRIVTLDDSGQRIMLTFAAPVEVTVTEVADPAAIKIEVIEKAAEDAAPQFSVRTSSFPFGETVGIKEGIINEALGWPEEGVRMIEDAQGTHFVEAGIFATEELAIAHLEKLQATGLMTFDLHIEQRNQSDIPGFIEP